MLVSGSHDATKRLWDVDEKKPLATLITPFGQRNEWAVVSPDGWFDGDPAGWSELEWRLDPSRLDLDPIQGYFADYYRPGLLAELLSAHVDAPRVPPANRSRVVPVVRDTRRTRRTRGRDG